MEWVYHWFFITSIICTYPVWLVLMAFGAAVPPGAEGFKWLIELTTRNGALGAIVGVPVTMIMYVIWPSMMALFYGMRINPLVDMSGAGIVNLALTGVIGVAVGFYLAGKLLPKIDAWFGVTRGFSAACQMYAAMGTAYVAVKAAKAGKRIIHKL